MAARTFILEPAAMVSEIPAMNSQALTLGAIRIRQHNGLYCLNDVHKASGGAAKHRPNQFLRNEQTQALIETLETAQICAVKTRKGNSGGTYACKELVAAYAAWISAAFHLRVLEPAAMVSETETSVVGQKPTVETSASTVKKKLMVATKTTYPVAVEFAGCQLLGKHVNAQDFVAMRPIVEGMGLDWQSQLEKIQQHPALNRQLYSIRGMVATDGKRRTMSCLPLSRVAFWLATVNSHKVAADIRDRVIAFQEQAADVLHTAFTQQHTAAHLWRSEYLPTYHDLHDTIAKVAATSSNSKFVHMNVNKAINSACGLASGQRATANARQAVLLMAAQMTATSVLQHASDHKTGYLACKNRLETLVNTVHALPSH